MDQYIEKKCKGVALPLGLAPVSLEFAIWDTAMGPCAFHRRFCVTRRAYMEMVSLGAREGDLVAIILGAKTPDMLWKPDGWVGWRMLYGWDDG